MENKKKHGVSLRGLMVAVLAVNVLNLLFLILRGRNADYLVKKNDKLPELDPMAIALSKLNCG